MAWVHASRTTRTEVRVPHAKSMGANVSLTFHSMHRANAFSCFKRLRDIGLSDDELLAALRAISVGKSTSESEARIST